MTAKNVMTKAEMVTKIQGYDPEFKYSKKKHTVEVLAKTLNKFEKPAKGESKDRMADGLRKATKNADAPKIPKAGTKRYIIMSAMAKGCTVEELQALCPRADNGEPWERQSVTSALRTDVRDLGWAYEVKDGKLFLQVPKGVSFE
jgi:hypothetical protein